MFETDIALTAADARNLTRPCVYIFWLLGVAQYVGMSEHGLTRPLAPNHEQVSKREFKYDKLEIQWQSDKATAKRIESELIWKHSPQFNTQEVAWIPSRSSGIPMPHKGYDKDAQEFLVISECGKVVFRSKDKKARSVALRRESMRFRKEAIAEAKTKVLVPKFP